MLSAAVQKSRRSPADIAAAAGMTEERLTLLLGGNWVDAARPSRDETLRMAAVFGLAPPVVEGWLRPGEPLRRPGTPEQERAKQAKHQERQKRRKGKTPE